MGDFWPKVADKALPTFSLVLRTAFLLLGISILVGFLPLPGDPRNRTLFGVICILYGVFGLLRFTLLRSRRREMP